MNGRSLASEYLRRASTRIKALELYFEEGDYADVVREAQETTELALKAVLRMIGVEPPKVHDVGLLLKEYEERLTLLPIEELRRASTRLRKERELSFYGDIDFLPSEQYTQADAKEALAAARLAVESAAVQWQSVGIGEEGGDANGGS